MEIDVWVRCRCLANRLRLRMLTVLMRRPNLNVSAVGVECSCSESVTSRHLADLERCGFLASNRVGRFLHYDLNHTDYLLKSVLAVIGEDIDRIESTIKAVTGFTHERRVHIVRTLHKGPKEFSALCSICGISTDAMKRHLQKLEKRDYIQRYDGVWEMKNLSDGLKNDLVNLIVG